MLEIEMPRRRSTRAELLARDEKQARIVADLVHLGADDVATQVTRCWSERLFGDLHRHRYRCRSVACLSCRRPTLAAYWRAYVRWAREGGSHSYVRLPVVDALSEARLIAKSLRNLRDRLAREVSWLFADLGFLGLTDGRDLHILVSHPGLSREQVGKRLQAIMPRLTLTDVPATSVIALSSSMLALLGSLQRGLQPARFSVLPREQR